MKELEKIYDPKSFEDRLYKYWMDEKLFVAHVNPDKKPYTIVMPPPNVTGNLHMGHALNNTIQDILIRYKRMDGYEALWVPGTDHASISTESKVVEKIKKDGKSKEELGRDGFLEEAWDWTEKYGGNIKNQLKKLGVSCDWSRDRFTLDEMLSKAVTETFIDYHKKGLIYRGNRIVNWCPNCETAISDAEVEHEDTLGHFYNIKYPIVGEDGFVIVATTRPETMLGDIALAVNPNDERYAHLVGKKVLLPLVNREIEVIADDYVDMEFGSGVVKITPSHDPNDFEVGARHDLGMMLIMDGKGRINENGGVYAGLDRFEARKKIVADLEAGGFLESIKDHEHAVGHCERCHTVIEPMTSKQWFVKMAPLAQPALDAYKKGELKFVPERFGKIYVNWLENIRDWCISRQLWWGHRLPVYYTEDGEEYTVSTTEPQDARFCKRDEDTLDTWFSSALWPFSTLGWPEKTEDFDYFFPTDVLATGYDIIFFWVIRMVFSSLEQTGKLPFHTVYLNGLVRDSQGRKMSKSLGNGIDPLQIIADYGADALRFTLVTGNSPGNDMRFYNERVEANRNFANKLWNATRFVMMNVDEALIDGDVVTGALDEDKWIVSRANELAKEVSEKLDSYEIGLAAAAIYEFTWEEFCDWYIEMVKPRLFGEDMAAKKIAINVLVYVLKIIVKLLHPFMPFITEEIWQALPGTEGSIMVSEWHKCDEKLVDREAMERVAYIKEAIKSIRNARAELNIAPSKKAKAIVVTENESVAKIFSATEVLLKSLASCQSVEIRADRGDIDDSYIGVVIDKAEVYLPLSQLIDVAKELERLSKDREKTIGEIARVEGKLKNEKFVSKAPENVVAEEREKLEKYTEMLKALDARIESVKKLQVK